MAKSTDTTINYISEATAKCTNCGTVYNLGSTIASFSTEICGSCHPFYTGKEILVDTAGRIEKFNARMSKAATTQVVKKAKARKTIQSIGEMIVDEPTEEVKEVKAPKPKVEKPAKEVETATEVKSEVEPKIETTEPAPVESSQE